MNTISAKLENPSRVQPTPRATLPRAPRGLRQGEEDSCETRARGQEAAKHQRERHEQAKEHDDQGDLSKAHDDHQPGFPETAQENPLEPLELLGRSLREQLTQQGKQVGK